MKARLVLTRNERAELFAGRAPKLAGAGKCLISEGYIYTLSPGFWIEINKVRRTRTGGWSLGYTIHDHRHASLLLRRTPPVHVEDAESSAPTAAAIEQARFESSYTTNVRAAVSTAGEGVGDTVQRHQTENAKRAARLERRRRRIDQDNLALEAKVKAYQEEAARRRIPIRDEVRAMRRAMNRPDDLERRLEAVRRKLDSDLDRAA